ncbi:MAG: hypothetical protein M1840_001473 [Geoglossum simile]|nr:MAG: hypothetical protein M1840_001473 [Geoglossum simile]
MAFTKNFSSHLAEPFRTSDGTSTDRVLGMLATFSEKFGPYANESQPAKKITNEKLIRAKVIPKPGVRVQRKAFLALNGVYRHQNEAANVVLAALKDPLLDKYDFVKNRNALNRAGVIAMIAEKVNVNVETSGVIERTLSAGICPEGVRLLEEFFGVSQYPNSNEMTLLAAAAGTTTKNLQKWFKDKRTRVMPLYALRRSIPMSPRLKKKICLNRYAFLKTGKTLGELENIETRVRNIEAGEEEGSKEVDAMEMQAAEIEGSWGS